jgi:hypothetical protein
MTPSDSTVASPELTGGAGFTFEDGVAAVYAAALLSETTAPGLPNRQVKRLSVQRGALGHPLDDVIVEAQGADASHMRLSLQVKRKLIVSCAESNTDFRETILRAHVTVSDPAFQVGIDRVGAVTGEISDNSKRSFETLCEWARSESTATGFVEKLRTKGVAGDKEIQFDDVRKILSDRIEVRDLDEATWSLLSHFVLMRFEMLHEGSVTEATAVAGLVNCLPPADRSKADDLWRRLLALVRVAEGHAASFDRKTLVARLNGAVRLNGAASMHRPLAVFAQDAKLASAEIGNSIDQFSVPRERFVHAVTSALAECRFVQIGGLPGTGKSAVLRKFLDVALSQGPALFLKADRLSGASWSQYATSIGCEGVGLEDLLVELAAMGSSTIYIDGLDRVEVKHRGIVVDVVNTLLASPLLAQHRMLVTVRDTGIEPLRTWLPAQFFAAGVKTVEVLELDDQEAKSLAVQRPALEHLLFGPDQVREIVRRPFFAAVLARQFANKIDGPRSEVELATTWWSGGGYGAEAAQAVQRRKTLVDLARAGASTLGRRIPSLGLDPQSLVGLEADGIIRDVRAGQTVRFVHDIYFEWAFLQLLISQGQLWLDVIREVGEPPVLGRVVELLSQAELKDGEDWQVRLEQLESATNARSQWLRAWMLGPFGLADFERYSSLYNEVMLAADSKRVSKLVVWYQAEKTTPNRFALDSDRFPDIGFAQRLQYADILALPSDIPQWRCLCIWLIKHIEQIAVVTRPEILSVFEVWQNAAADVKNPTSTSILSLVGSWLRDIEVRFHARAFPRDLGVWEKIDRDVIEEFESRLRSIFLRAGRAYPSLVKEYLAALEAAERAPRRAVKEVIDYSLVLSDACPRELVDFLLRQMLRPLPEEIKRRSQGSPYGYDPHSHEWQSLSIDDQHSYFPCAPTRQPFPALFGSAPDEARRLVRELTNHAITSWRQLHQLDWNRRASPIPLTLTFPWGVQTFWGAEQEYVWSRGTWGSHVVGSGLMALDDWAFQEIEKGRSVDDVLRSVLEGHESVGVLGVACAVALEFQHHSAVTLPLLTSQRLWTWDIKRCIQERGENIGSLMGFMPHDQVHSEAVRRLNRKNCRKYEIRSLASACILFGGDLAEQASKAIIAFPSDLPFDYDEDRQEPGTVEHFRRTAEIWAEIGKRENYRATPSADGASVVVEVENPKAQGPDIERIKQRQQTMTEHLRLLNWVHESFEQNRASDRLALGETIAEGRRLDGPALFNQGHSHVELSHQRQAAVAGVAAAVIRFGKSTSAADLGWAADVCFRAWLTPEAPSDLFFRGSVLMYHPALYACRGLAGLLHHDVYQRPALEALIQLTTHPYDQVVIEALAGLLGSWSHSPAIAWLGLRLANSLAIIERYPRDPGSSDYEKRERARAAKVVKECLEQCDTLNVQISPVDAPPPAWVENPGARRIAKGRRREQVVIGWQHPNHDLHANFLAKILPNIPVEEAMQDEPRREMFLSWCSALVTWTVERLNPTWSRAAEHTEEFEASSLELFEWRHEFYRFLARVTLHLEPDESVARFVGPAARANDQTFASLVRSFVDYLTRNVMDAASVPTKSLEVLQQLVPRLLSHESWSRLTRRGLATDDTDLAEMIQMLFFIKVDGAMGAARFANRDWRDVEIIFPLIEPILKAYGSISRVASAFLTLCERAIEAYPIESFVRDMVLVLPRAVGLPSGWRGTAITARLAGLIQQFSQKTQPLPSALARDLLKALDILVDLGDRRAAAVQTSEIFKDIRLGAVPERT